MCKGQLTFETPTLFPVGFLITNLLGGLSGVPVVSPPIDFPVPDSYFNIAHFRCALFGTIVFAITWFRAEGIARPGHAIYRSGDSKSGVEGRDPS
ncbi:MAG: cytochrome oxidase subunit 1 [Mycobacterium sp.]|jgi:heme/copper-type cytochrome/quinol oxidase subunit 1|nr:cytochrome oxidase subunit 1 [Mycobacterium sp.]